MMVLWGFLKTIPGKLWGYLCIVAGLVATLAYFYFSGKSKAKSEAKVQDLTEKVIAHQEVTKAVLADAKAVDKIEKEIDALPISDVADRARKWVRK